jgi:streptogramin lyase
LWTVGKYQTDLVGIDTGSGERIGKRVPLADGLTEARAMLAADGKLWITVDDTLIVADAKSGEVEKRHQLPQGTREQVVTAGGGAVYVGYEPKDQPVVVRLGATDFARGASGRIIDDVDHYEALMVDGQVLWVLAGNGFELHKADAATLAEQGSAVLGEDPANPDGPRAAKYGYGDLAAVGGKLWIADTYKNKLLSVDKATLAATVVTKLPELAADGVPSTFVSNKDSVFLAVADGTVVRFDGTTGERLKTYTFGDGAAKVFTVTDDKMYLNPDELAATVIEVDIATGATTNTYTGVNAELLVVA